MNNSPMQFLFIFPFCISLPLTVLSKVTNARYSFLPETVQCAFVNIQYMMSVMLSQPVH